MKEKMKMKSKFKRGIYFLLTFAVLFASIPIMKLNTQAKKEQEDIISYSPSIDVEMPGTQKQEDITGDDTGYTALQEEEMAAPTAIPLGMNPLPINRTMGINSTTAVEWQHFSRDGTANQVDTGGMHLSFSSDPSFSPVGKWDYNNPYVKVSGATLVGIWNFGDLGGYNQYYVAISNVTVGQGEHVTITLSNPPDKGINPSTKSIAIHRKTSITWEDAVANGVDNRMTSSEIILSFDGAVHTLALDNITVAGAAKETLTRVDDTYRTFKLGISNISVPNGGEITVNISKPTGYVLSLASKKVKVFIESPDDIYGIEFSESEYNFYAAIEGYSEPETHTVTVNNMGNRATGNLNVSLSGSDASSFILSRTTISSIAKLGSDSFTITPLAGLSIGTHFATVTVSGDHGISKNFEVSFKVLAEDEYTALQYDIDCDGTPYTEDTTAILLFFDQDPGLSAYEVWDTENPYVQVSGATLQTVLNRGVAEGMESRKIAYQLNISNLPEEQWGRVTVTLKNPPGQNIVPLTKTIEINRATGTGGEYTSIWERIRCNGTPYEADTTIIWLDFDRDPLLSEKIGWDNDNPYIQVSGATLKSIYNHGYISGPGYEFVQYGLEISNLTVSQWEDVTVTLKNPTGKNIASLTKSVSINRNANVTWTGAIANGVYDNTTSTEVILDFSAAVPNLAASDIIVSGAAKGALTPLDATYKSFKLEISDITVGNGENITLTITKLFNYKITPASETVKVYVASPPTYIVTMNPPSDYSFEEAAYGYNAQNGYTVRITNGGTLPTGDFNIALSGGDSSSFTLDKSFVKGFDENAWDTFTITPRAGLPVGTYQETVTVSGDGGFFGSFDVSFTVRKKALEITGFSISKPYDGTGVVNSLGTLSFSGLAEGETATVDAANVTATYKDITVGEHDIIFYGEFGMTGGTAHSANYTITQPTNVTGSISSGSIPLKGTHYVSTALNAGGWTNTDFVITAADGYKISRTNTAGGIWTDTLTETEETADGSLSFYMMCISTGEISGVCQETYKIDKTLPIACVQYKDSTWKALGKETVFRRFFKLPLNVCIQGEDQNTDNKVEYYRAAAPVSNPAVDITGWTTGSSFTVSENETFILYVRVTDVAGNFVIAHEGVVVYTDSTKATEQISFTKESGINQTADINLNGNTIANIMNGTVTLEKGRDYTVNGGTITFHSAYLENLTTGDHTMTISFHPGDEAYVEDTENEAPLSTTIALSVLEAVRIQLDITWGAMEFTYNEGIWNPEEHSYVNGSWEPSAKDGNKITVVNNGNVKLDVMFAYTQIKNDVSGSFIDHQKSPVHAPLPLGVSQSTDVYLILSDLPKEVWNGVTIGTVTVSTQMGGD